MFKLIEFVLKKMGNWFGIIFKIILPFLAMYRPIKTFSFSLVVIGTYMGGYAESLNTSLNTFAMVLFGLLYAVLVVLLIWAPKAASAVEFLLMLYYFAFLGGVYFAGFYINYFAGMTPYLLTYMNELPLILVFLIGKIIFFFFIKSNRKNIEEMKNDDNQMVYHSEDYIYSLGSKKGSKKSSKRVKKQPKRAHTPRHFR